MMRDRYGFAADHLCVILILRDVADVAARETLLSRTAQTPIPLLSPTSSYNTYKTGVGQSIQTSFAQQQKLLTTTNHNTHTHMHVLTYLAQSAHLTQTHAALQRTA